MAEHEEEHGGEGESHGSGGGHGAGGHGGAHEEHEGAPEWLISFADNVALLMGFFVILLAMNMAPKSQGPAGGEGQGGMVSDSRMMDFVIAMREGFNNPIKMSSTKSEEQPFVRRIIERQGGMGARPTPQGRHPESQSLERGTALDITAKVEFDDNSSVVTPDAREMIAGAAKHLRDRGYIIEVRGHASPFEAQRSFDAGVRLGFDRALAVSKVLLESGIRKEALNVTSRGDSDRLVARPQDREQARSNQRVEIIITSEQTPPDPYSSRGGSGGTLARTAGAAETTSAEHATSGGSGGGSGSHGTQGSDR